MRVLKYTIPWDGEVHELMLPHPGEIVQVGFQNKDFVFWVRTSHEIPAGPSPRLFRLFATGELIPDYECWLHRGTAHSTREPIGNLVLHLFEKVILSLHPEYIAAFKSDQ